MTIHSLFILQTVFPLHNSPSPERQGPCAGEDIASLLQPAVADVGCVWRILHY